MSEDKKGFISGLSGALENRNIQQLMARMGTEIDPHGAGGMIGRPTSALIENQAMGEAAEEQEKIRKQEMQNMMILLSGGKISYDERGNIKTISGGADSALRMPDVLKALGGDQGLGDPYASLEMSQTPQTEGTQTIGAANQQQDQGTVMGILDKIMKSLNLGGK